MPMQMMPIHAVSFIVQVTKETNKKTVAARLKSNMEAWPKELASTLSHNQHCLIWFGCYRSPKIV